MMKVQRGEWVYMLSHSVVSGSSVALQAPLSMKFPRQEYWSWLPFPTPGYLSNPGIEPTWLVSPVLAGGFSTTGTTWKASGIQMALQFREFSQSEYAPAAAAKVSEDCVTVTHVPISTTSFLPKITTSLTSHTCRWVWPVLGFELMLVCAQNTCSVCFSWIQTSQRK